MHFGGGELDKRVAESLDGTVDVAFDDDVEFLEGAESLTACDIIECESLGCAHAEFALQLLAFVGYFTGLLFGVKHVECIACGGGAVKAENQGRFGRACLFDALVALVEHGFDFTIMCSGKYDVAYTEGAVLHKYGGNVATAFVER